MIPKPRNTLAALRATLAVLIIFASLALATTSPSFPFPRPLDLDSIFTPRTGRVLLNPGTTYLALHSKWLRSCVFASANSFDVPPVVEWHGQADSGAFFTRLGDSAGLQDVDVIGDDNTYAMSTEGGILADHVRVKGGGGLLRTVGADGLVRLSNCKQLESTFGYVFYCGPRATKVTSKTQTVIVNGVKQPLCLSYDERTSAAIELDHVDAMFGSGNVANCRVVGFEKFTAKFCNFSDTHAQSDVRGDGSIAVDNAVLRIHHGGDALIEDSSFAGNIYIGPMAEGDGGINTNGKERTFRDAERLRSITFRRCDFDANEFKITPGVLLFRFEDCIIRAKGSTIVATPFPYMNRPASVGTFDHCRLISTGSLAPKAFNNADGSARMSLSNGTTVSGAAAAAVKKKAA